MRISRDIGLTLAFLFGWLSLAVAQERESSSQVQPVQLAQAKTADPKADKAAQPAVTIVLRSADELFSDFQFIFDLANEGPRYKTLADTLEAFLEGVDRKKPAGLQVFVDGTDFKFVGLVPVKPADLKKFLDNLASLDVKSKKEADGTYTLTMNKAPLGFLRVLGDQVVIGEGKNEVLLVKVALAPIPGRDDDITVLLDNSSQPVEDRRKAIDTLRANTEKSLKKKEDESDPVFAARKATALQQLDELERFFADSAKILAGWNLSAKDKHGVFDLELTAAPNTSLAKSVELLGSKDHLFAGIPTEGTVASFTINFPIDDMRQKHLAENVKLTRAVIESEIDKDDKASASQKTADKAVIAAISDALDANIAAGSLNGFLRIFPHDGGKFSTVGGLHVADAAKVMAALKAIEDREGAGKVKFNIDSEGDVKIHSFEFSLVRKEAPEFLGEDGKIFVGTGPDTIWLASGDNAVDRMKTAIKAAQKEPAGQTKSTTIDLQMRVGPWVELLDSHRSNDEGTTVVAAKPSADSTKAGFQKQTQSSEEKQKAKRRDIRRMAIDAMKTGKDTLSLRLERDGGTVKLRVQFDEDLLKFVGKVAGKEVKENLE